MPADAYFVTWKGRRDGPYTLEQLAALLQRGELSLLHSVETAAGPLSLRQLLIETEPARWPQLVATAGSSPAPIPPPSPFAPPSPPMASAAAAPPAPAPPGAAFQPATTPPPMQRPSAPPETGEPPDALQAYMLCGLSFLLPPLAWPAVLKANALHRRGHPDLAVKLRWLSLAFAAVGVVFWAVIVRLW